MLKADDIALVPERQCQLLRGVAMFAPLPSARSRNWHAGLVPLTFAPGDVLMRLGEIGDRFVIIDSGTVERADQGSARSGPSDPGGYCGEIALLRGIPRTATVQSTTEVDAYALSGRGLRGRGHRGPRGERDPRIVSWTPGSRTTAISRA